MNGRRKLWEEQGRKIKGGKENVKREGMLWGMGGGGKVRMEKIRGRGRKNKKNK